MRFFFYWWRGVLDAARDAQTRPLILTVVLLLASGTVFYAIVEGWSPLDAFYFSVVTLATVGYGDFAPETGAGKLVTALYVLAGVAAIITFANVVLQRAHSIRISDRESDVQVGSESSSH